MTLHSTRNETEAAQLVIRPENPLLEFRIASGPLTGPGGAAIPSSNLELFQVKYLNLARASDRSSKAGWWPDPLLPIAGPLELGPGTNHAFWIRVLVPKDARAGVYRGALRLAATGFAAEVPIELTVYDFALPDRMTCATAFGFSPGEVFRYHGLKTEEQKRAVLDKYLANL